MLEGVGLIEKRSKNVIAWRGAENVSKELHGKAPAASMSIAEELDKVRDEVGTFYEEDAKLDLWLNQLKKLSNDVGAANNEPYRFCAAHEIVTAMHFPVKTGEPFRSLPQVDAKGNTMTSFIAIRAPRGSVMEVPNPTEGNPPFARAYHLGISTRADFLQEADDDEQDANKKRKPTDDLPTPNKKVTSPLLDNVQICLLPTAVDTSTFKIKSMGLHRVPAVAILSTMPVTPVVPVALQPGQPIPSTAVRQAAVVVPPATIPEQPVQSAEIDSFPYELTPALSPEEGVSDFFSKTEPGESVLYAAQELGA